MHLEVGGKQILKPLATLGNRQQLCLLPFCLIQFPSRCKLALALLGRGESRMTPSPQDSDHGAPGLQLHGLVGTEGKELRSVPITRARYVLLAAGPLQGSPSGARPGGFLPNSPAGPRTFVSPLGRAHCPGPGRRSRSPAAPAAGARAWLLRPGNFGETLRGQCSAREHLRSPRKDRSLL